MNTNISLPLLDLNSAHCALRVENAIKTVPALAGSNVDLEKHIANLNNTATAPDVREAVAAIRNAGYNVATEQYQLNTTGITCAGCANKAGSILNTLPGVISAKVDHVTNTAELEVVSGLLSFDDLLAALKPADYGLLREAA